MTSKQILGVVVAAVVLVGGYFLFSGSSAPAPTPVGDQPSAGAPQGGGAVRTALDQWVNGLFAGDVAEKWIEKTLPAGDDQIVLYRNQTGHDVYVTFADVSIPTGSTASSTLAASVVATSSASFPNTHDLTLPSLANQKDYLIRGVNFATSSTATTTSSLYAVAANLATGHGTILVPDGWYVIGYLQMQTAFTNHPCDAAGLCESATSTNRGYNPVFRVKLSSSRGF